jgi:hypothetical protein
MLQCDTPLVTTPSPLSCACPQCGGGRTEAIGRATTGDAIQILCSSCDRRSEVPVDARAAEAADVTAELEAMITVARALARLPNRGGRQRVLNWALDRFTGEPIVVVSSPSPAAPDPALTLPGDVELFGRASRGSLRASTTLDDPLDDLFEVLPPPVFDDGDIAAAVAMRRERRLRAALSSFVAACRRLSLRLRHPYTFGLLNRI